MAQFYISCESHLKFGVRMLISIGTLASILDYANQHKGAKGKTPGLSSFKSEKTRKTPAALLKKLKKAIRPSSKAK